LHSAALIVDGAVYVPLRFVGESFGADVTWAPAEREVVIETRTPVDSQPWRYRVLVGVTDRTVKSFGGLEAVRLRIAEQFDRINATFEESPFAGKPVFEINPDEIYTVPGDGRNEALARKHPDHELLMVYDAYPSGGGGWYGGPYQAVHHAWPTGDWGNLFDRDATRGIVHELTHAIGHALDLYALHVDAERNPVNRTAYRTPPSVMSDPYTAANWDDHAIESVNRAGGYVIEEENDSWPATQFPETMTVSVRKSDGSGVGNAAIRLYPVKWYSYEVLREPALSGTTDADGAWTLPENPFRPFREQMPWGMEFANFLVEAELPDGRKLYDWMPVDRVQLASVAEPSTYLLTLLAR